MLWLNMVLWMGVTSLIKSLEQINPSTNQLSTAVVRIKDETSIRIFSKHILRN